MRGGRKRRFDCSSCNTVRTKNTEELSSGSRRNSCLHQATVMKEYSEAKTYKKKAELRNSEVYSSAEIIIIPSRTGFDREFVYHKPRKLHMLADIYASSSEY